MLKLWPYPEHCSVAKLGIMLLSALVFGRAYCGWACPAGGLQEAAFAINNQPVPGWLGRVKWVIWAFWIATIGLLAIQAGGYSQVMPLLGIEHGISLLEPHGYIIYAVVTGLALGLSAWAGRRGFCHAVCWMAPFMVIGRRIGAALRLPGLRLRTNPAACTDCLLCTRNCPMSIDVHNLVRNGAIVSDDCILCGTCVDLCRKDVISFQFSRPVKHHRHLQQDT
jgi:ferredoxin-type protein NapH